jgi:hypothetical protein
MSTVRDGWRLTLEILLALLRRLLAKLAKLKRGRGDGRRDYRDIRCLTPPPHVRARPDPFIYSQQWLSSRGLGITWDNPDFRIIDRATGAAVDRFSLTPDTDYVIEATIHNGSWMAALGTTVQFEVRAFGAATTLVSDLGLVGLDVPAMGTAIASVDWHTPATGGHNCLLATIVHPDDANPLNNVGQHNTDIAHPASPTRQIAFAVGNPGREPRTVTLRMDSYQLPDDPRCPRGHRERHSHEYLRRLQAMHDPRRFPVPDFLRPRLSAEQLRIEADNEVEVTLELEPPPPGSAPVPVNVNVLAGETLIGGITAYVLPEET